MSPLEALWQMAGFFTASLALGAFSALLAKLLWRRQLKAHGLWPLVLWPALGAAACAVGGLLVFGQDGRMATYSAMVAAAALGSWWVAFVSPPRRN